jgi:hypothetical protein
VAGTRSLGKPNTVHAILTDADASLIDGWITVSVRPVLRTGATVMGELLAAGQ